MPRTCTPRPAVYPSSSTTATPLPSPLTTRRRAPKRAALGGPLFAAEFGGNTDADNGFRAATELFLRDSLAEQDRRLIGGAVWAYFPSDNTFSVVDAAGDEKGDLVNVLARPYARRIAGVPTAMRFDPQTKEFLFSWRVDGVAPGGGVTELFVPRRHYPTRLPAELSPGVSLIVRSDNVLLVAPAPGEYTILLRPDPGG